MSAEKTRIATAMASTGFSHVVRQLISLDSDKPTRLPRADTLDVEKRANSGRQIAIFKCLRWVGSGLSPIAGAGHGRAIVSRLRHGRTDSPGASLRQGRAPLGAEDTARPPRFPDRNPRPSFSHWPIWPITGLYSGACLPDAPGSPTPPLHTVWQLRSLAWGPRDSIHWGN